MLTSDLIADTRRLLMGGQREAINKLAAPAISGATSLTFQNPPEGITGGVYLQVGLELFYVWSVSGSTATVEPAQAGSVSDIHNTGDIVTVSPKFPDFAILKALNDSIRSLSSPALGMYRTPSVDLTYASGGYDLAGVTDLLDIVDIRAHRGGTTSRDWPLIDTWQLDRAVDPTDFPSGLALFLIDTFDVGSTIRVRYRAGFSPLVNISDDVETVTGLPVTALDIPPLGAAIRLVHPREIKRNFTEAQGDGRRSGEVGPGAVAGSVNALERDYYRRISEEASRLSALNPPSGYVPPAAPYTLTRSVIGNIG